MAGGDLICRAVGVVDIGGVAGSVGIGAVVIAVPPDQILKEAYGGEKRSDDEEKPEKEIAADVGAGVNPSAAHEENTEVGKTPDEGKRELMVMLERVWLAEQGEVAP